MRAWVLTSWVGTGADGDPFVPALADYGLPMYADVVGVDRITPELALIEIEALPMQYNQIQADPEYGSPAIVWDDGRGGIKPKDEAPGAQEIAALQAKLTTMGLSLAEAQAALGDAPDTKTREQLGTALAEWLKKRGSQ